MCIDGMNRKYGWVGQGRVGWRRKWNGRGEGWQGR